VPIEEEDELVFFLYITVKLPQNVNTGCYNELLRCVVHVYNYQWR